MRVSHAVERLEERLDALHRVSLLAVILEGFAVPPTWAEALGDGRYVRVIGGLRAERRRIGQALAKGQRPEGVVVLEHRVGASQFIARVIDGPAFEVFCWGARGDRKTSAALAAVAICADLHQADGFALPMRWTVSTGSHTEHVLKLCRSVLAGHWGGCWSLRDDKHTAVLTIGGVELAHLDLVGSNDPDALSRLRMESHAGWGEEIAPAALEAGAGVSEDSWAMQLTSIRLPTRRPVAMSTSNYPDEDFWAWQRAEAAPHPGTASVRIPAGESASPEDRDRQRVALQHRPDLLARLLDGQPGSVIQGPQVAKGYNALTHVAPAPLRIVEAELWCAWDSAPNAHTHAVVIGQRVGPEVRIYAGLVSEETGLKQHLEVAVVPWFARHAPWALGRGGEALLHRYDPAMDTEEGGDIDMNPVARIRRTLGGSFRAGAVAWPARSGPMLTLLNLGNGRGGMALQIDPGEDTVLLRKALASRWHYAVTRGGTVIRDLPAKPSHPWEDLGDAFCYFAGGVAPSRDPADARPRGAYQAQGATTTPHVLSRSRPLYPAGRLPEGGKVFRSPNRF
jgi:hypothetical protein